MEVNPFASRFIDPHRCKFIYPAILDSHGRMHSSGCSPLSELASRLILTGGVQQICGPHGCGKSTLALRIAKSSLTYYTNYRTVIIRPRGRGLVSIYEQLMEEGRRNFGHGRSDHRCLTIVDGFENLSWLHRGLLLANGRQHAGGFIITTHRLIPKVPVLAVLKPSLQHFRLVVSALQRDAMHPVPANEIDAVFTEYGGDYRLALAMLYDIYANRQNMASRSSACKTVRGASIEA